MSRSTRPVPSSPAGPVRAGCAVAWLAVFLAVAAPTCPAFAQDAQIQEQSGATECWRGWGYLLDARTGGYKSTEILLVAMGAPAWEIGQPVELFVMDRDSGLISDTPSFTVLPENPRQYFRGRLNYLDTTATIEGSEDRMVIGLSHIEPAMPGVPAKENYNRWACGLPEQ